MKEDEKGAHPEPANRKKMEGSECPKGQTLPGRRCSLFLFGSLGHSPGRSLTGTSQDSKSGPEGRPITKIHTDSALGNGFRRTKHLSEWTLLGI